MTGEEFGPYRLESLLARGGMGEVWRAVDTSQADRVVALKVLGAWLGGDPDFTARFRRESALVARLTNPHIVPIHRYGDVGGRLYIDMPLVEGTDLGTLLAEQGPLPPARAVEIVDQVADALDTAHRAGLVHRDVKPSNVLVAGRATRDHAYLIDFGIARAQDVTAVSVAGTVIGTLGYMAPERFEGDADHRGDVYALGCVLHEMLTGRPAFAATGLPAYWLAHSQGPRPRPSAVRPEVPAQLDDVVATATAVEPAARHRSAGALAAAARAALDAAAGAATLPPPPSSIPARPADDPSGRGAPAAAPVAPSWPDYPPTRHGPPPGTRLGGPPETRLGAAPAPRPIPHRPAANHAGPDHAAANAGPAGTRRHPPGLPSPSAPPAARPWWRRPVVLAVAGVLVVALVATGIVLALPRDGAGSTGGSVSAGALDAVDARTLTGHEGTVTAVALAEVAGRPIVATGSDDTTVRLWDAASGEQVGSLTGHTDAVTAIASGQVDGRNALVTTGTDQSVQVWDLDAQELVAAWYVAHNPRAIALDGTTAITGSVDGTAIRIDLRTGELLGDPLTASAGIDALAVGEIGGRPVVVAGSENGSVQNWDLETGAEVGTDGSSEAVTGVALTDLDGTRAVVWTGHDRTVHVRDTATGVALGDWPTGHPSTTYCLAVADLGGRTVAVTGGEDRELRVTDLTTGAQIGDPLTGHTDGILAVTAAPGPDGLVIVSGSYDDTARIWTVPTG